MLFQFSITTCVCMCLVDYHFVNGCMHLLLIDSPNKPKCLHWNHVLYFLHATELDAFQFGIYCCSGGGHLSLPHVTPGVNRDAHVNFLCRPRSTDWYLWIKVAKVALLSVYLAIQINDCFFFFKKKKQVLNCQQPQQASVRVFFPKVRPLWRIFLKKQPLLAYICSHQNQRLLES